MAALIFIGLNLVDAFLARMDLGLGAVEINPLVPPIVANLSARGLIAIAVILAFYLVKRETLLVWANLVMCILVSWHFISSEISPFVP